MNADALFGVGFGFVAAAATIVTVLRPAYKRWAAQREQRYDGITGLLEGRPDRVDSNGR